jgi:tRNA 2-selenouridine synthase
VGTVYKQQSQQKAIELGYKYVEPKLEYFIRESLKLAPKKTIAVHCWRGGMRSQSFARHLAENGFKKVYVISGGYKAFRNYVLNTFKQPVNLQILGGYTGSGKTYILKQLEKSGHQVIDLEGLAAHKGSAFGGLGNEKQPATEHFENLLFWKLKDLNPGEPVWVEDESQNIGRVNIPGDFYQQMKKAPVYFLNIPKTERVKFLVNEYAGFDRHELAGSVQRITKRLGGLNTKKALEHLEKGEFFEVAMITLDYYDKFYLKGLDRRKPEKVFPLKASHADHEKNAAELLRFFEAKQHEHHQTHAI